MSDDGLWFSAGEEPSVGVLLNDPIMALLLRYDGLTTDHVWAAVAEARTALDGRVADGVQHRTAA